MAFENGKKWHYVKNGEAAGPVMGDEIRRMAATGTLTPATKIWTPGLAQWIDAGTFPELFAPAEPAPPPLPNHGQGGIRDLPHAAHGVAPQGYGFAGQPIAGDQGTESGYISARPERRYGGFWLRVLALIIDGLVISGIVWLALRFTPLYVYARGFVANVIPIENFEVLQEALQQSRVVLERGEFLNWMVLASTNAVIAALYFVILQATPLQATIGKAILGLRLITSKGDNVGLFRSLWRYICTFISSAIFGIGFLFAGWTREKTALHDMLAGTRVVRRR